MYNLFHALDIIIKGIAILTATDTALTLDNKSTLDPTHI